MRTKLKKNNKINVVTLGCSKNIYDSEVLMGQLKANNKNVVHEDENDDGNIVVINTCGFIGDAKEESINTILRYVHKKEQGEIVYIIYVDFLIEVDRSKEYDHHEKNQYSVITSSFCICAPGFCSNQPST